MPRSTLRVAKPVIAAAPHVAMPRCQVRSGAHTLAIAARLATPGALPDNMMLASMPGLHERRMRKLASLKQVREPGPFDTPMLGAGQRVTTNRNVHHLYLRLNLNRRVVDQSR